MKALKEKLYSCIEKYGLLDARTVAVSQEIDVLVVEEQRRRLMSDNM